MYLIKIFYIKCVKKKVSLLVLLCGLNELCDNSLKDIINDKYIENINDICVLFFCFSNYNLAVYSIHKFLNISFDLHGGTSNIVSNKNYWLYNVNGENYYGIYIKNMGLWKTYNSWCR